MIKIKMKTEETPMDRIYILTKSFPRWGLKNLFKNYPIS